MLGKLCPLLGSLRADICDQDGKYPRDMPWRLAYFLLNNLAFDSPKTLVTGSIKYHRLGVQH